MGRRSLLAVLLIPLGCLSLGLILFFLTTDRSALTLAVGEARRDAEALAQAAGGTLGKMIYLTSGFAAVPQPFDFQSVVVTSTLESGGTRIMPGDLTVTAVANAVWQFVPRQGP